MSVKEPFPVVVLEAAMVMLSIASVAGVQDLERQSLVSVLHSSVVCAW